MTARKLRTPSIADLIGNAASRRVLRDIASGQYDYSAPNVRHELFVVGLIAEETGTATITELGRKSLESWRQSAPCEACGHKMTPTSLLALRIEHVRDEVKREAERASSLVGEDLPIVVRLRTYVAELTECARLVREDGR